MLYLIYYYFVTHICIFKYYRVSTITSDLTFCRFIENCLPYTFWQFLHEKNFSCVSHNVLQYAYAHMYNCSKSTWWSSTYS